MIPKVIHYCWFGPRKKSELNKRCIDSWKSLLPDYEICEWNQENFDIESNLYIKQAYHARKYAFVADYARLSILYERGVYLDADIEMVRPIDDLLRYPAFMGFGNALDVTGSCTLSLTVIGAEKNNEYINYLMGYYKDAVFIKNDGTYDLRINSSIATETSRDFFIPDNKRQTMKMGNVELFPMDYFEPINPFTGRDITSDHTFCLHWHDCSWGRETLAGKAIRIAHKIAKKSLCARR